MKPPLFIIGNPRSGTTLLRLMLTCHRNIVIPPEAGFAIWLYPKYQHWNPANCPIEPFLLDLQQSRKFETWGLKRTILEQYIRQNKPQTYSELVSAVYQAYMVYQHKSNGRWGDKNNYYLEHIGTIKELFPQTLFIHIVRDPRGVVCSYQQLSHTEIRSDYAPILPDKAGDIARVWKSNIQTIRRSFKQIGWQNVHELRFEDLLADTESVLRNVCEFLEEPYDLAMLGYHMVNRTRTLEPEEFLQWKRMTLEPPRSDRIDRFRNDLSVEDTFSIEQITKEELHCYRYNPIHSF